MARKRLKRNCGERVDNEPNIMSADRISQLPDCLIHYIFSFLPTIHLVRMSRVSRRWRRMWVSTPFLYFDSKFDDVTFDNKVNEANMFLKFVGKCLRYRKLYMQPDTFVTSFKFHSHLQLGYVAQRIDGWVRFAIQSKVKELDLSVRGYCSPQFIFTASSLTQLKFHARKFEVTSLSTLSSLTQLELNILKLEAPFLLKFPNLKVFSLVLVESNSESLQNLISGCPAIEDLHLRLTRNYGYIDITSIDFAIKLRTLKNLSLFSVEFTDRWLEGLVSGLPLLEKFTLSSRHKFEDISIHNHSLKYCSISECLCLRKVTFRTPNLVCLDLSCGARSIISIEGAPNLFQAKFRLVHDYRSASYFDLVHFLSNLCSLKKLKLSIWLEDMIFPEDIRNTFSPPLPNLKHLEASLYFDHKRNSELWNFLVWCAPSVETLKIHV